MSNGIYYPETYSNLPIIDQANIEEIITGACNRTGHDIRLTFPTTYLYIKQHSVSGKMYFGKTMQDVDKYPGSGVYWTRHINKYGKDKVQTIWSKEFNNPTDIVTYALQFSIINNIVDSKKWANAMSENGLDGGFAGCKHYKNIITNEVKMFHNSVPIPEGYETFSFTKNSKWYTNTKTGEVTRSTIELTGDWVNTNNHLKGANHYIDPKGIVHQVKPENARADWVLYSHSQGKRLYSDGTTVTLYEHGKQPQGWEIYDEKFGKRMYTLTDGSRKWFKPGTEPKDATEYVSTKGCRQYINLETRHIIQVPHGTQPLGYTEYSAQKFNLRYMNNIGNIKFFNILDNNVDDTQWFLIPTYYKHSDGGFRVLCYSKNNDRKYLSKLEDGWVMFNKLSDRFSTLPSIDLLHLLKKAQ